MKPCFLICGTAYQNYNVAVNLSDKTIYTYMGVLKPRMGSAGYSSAGQLSPLLKDPYYKTIGIGTRIFLGGGIGYVAWPGTQFNPECAPFRKRHSPRRRRNAVRDWRPEADELPLSGGDQYAGLRLHLDRRHRCTDSHSE